jgi:hypothetical protein
MEGSGSGSLQLNYGSGCGSRRSKNIRIRILNTENRTAPDVWTRAPIEEEPDQPTENVQTSNNQVHLHVVAVVKPKNIYKKSVAST